MSTTRDQVGAQPHVRLCPYLPPAIDRRLRLYQLMRGHKTLSKALAEHLDETLPALSDLTALLLPPEEKS